MANSKASCRNISLVWVVLVFRVVLRAVCFTGFFVFIAWLFIWRNDSYAEFGGTLDEFGMRGEDVEYLAGDGTETLARRIFMVVLFQWVPVLVLIYAVALLRSLPRPDVQAPFIKLRKIQLRARALARWQAPLHRFWVYWCGGLSLRDLLVVAIYVALHAFWFAKLTKQAEARFNALEELGLAIPYGKAVQRIKRFAFAFGIMLWPSFLLLFFPMAHISFLSGWLGTHYADLIRWHRWIGHAAMWVLSLHGILWYIYWGLTNSFWSQLTDWSTLSPVNYLAGTIAYVFGLLLWATSLEFVRRNFFEVFYRSHVSCFVLFVVFSTVHYAYAWTWWLPGLVVYGLDVALRAGQGLNATAIRARPAADGSFTTIEIRLAKDFKCRRNEELFLLISQISNWQWCTSEHRGHFLALVRTRHPFSVCDLLENPKRAVLHCKVFDSWTTELLQRARLQQPLAARVAGPLGTRRDHCVWRDYSTVVLVGGGIGAVPVLAILKDIVGAAAADDARLEGARGPPTGLRRAVFVWVSRHGSEFGLMDAALLRVIQDCEWLDVRFHITAPLSARAAVSLDAEQPSAVDPKWLPLTHHWASPFRLPVNRPATARLSSPFLEILTATLAFAGAFFGTILGYSYTAGGPYSKDPPNSMFWKTGLVQLAVQTVMILGLPYALVVLPVTLYRALQDWRARVVQPTAWVIPDNDDDELKLQDVGLEEFLSQTAAVSYSRPDLFAIIRSAVTAEKGHVGVFAGGPASLRSTANNATYSMQQKCNLFGRLVHYFDESFEL